MKTEINKKAKNLAIVVLSIFFISNSYAQILQGPKPQWILEEWAAVNWDLSPRTQDESGDEWYYNHTKFYENGVHVGYVACGYATFSDAVVTKNDQNSCYKYPDNINVDCDAFETMNDERGALFQMIMRYDLEGNVIWCKRYNQDGFFKIIQDSDGNLIAAGLTLYVNDKNGNAIRYNPTLNPYHQGYSLTCQNPAVYKRKMNIVKLDANGQVLWNYIYGMQSGGGNTWEKEQSEGLSLIEYDGGYRIVGRTTDDFLYHGIPGYNGFMVQINKSGEILHKEKYLYPSKDNMKALWFMDIKEGNGHIAVSGWEESSTTGVVNAAVHYFPKTNTWLHNATNLHLINPSVSSTPNNHAKSIFLTFLDQYDLFAVPVFYNNINQNFNGDADCEIHFFNDDFTQSPQPPPLAIQAGHYKAYDLKMGITEITDGFATVSSKQLSGVPTYNSIKPFLVNRYPTTVNSSCPDWFDQNYVETNNWIEYWDTDASVARYKYNTTTNTFDKKWETTFDPDNTGRENFPGDIKRQECLYGITVDDIDEAIVISGNTSNNFDDTYLVKLYNDNCIGLAYDISDPSDNLIEINSNTTWNSSKSVIGELRIKSGNTLTISGAGTVIGFADSKRTGIKTQIFIEKNARLIVDGAKLTADSRCAGAVWEGIILDGDNAHDQLPLIHPLYQAKLELKNNAILDNAMYPISFGKGDWNDFGGLVEAKDATIRCTRRAIAFMSYPFLNHSYFNRCNFSYVPSITDPPLSLITLWENKGVSFEGCSFVDNTGINIYKPNTGNGIYSVDASYSVTYDCHFPPGVPGVMPCPYQYFTRSSFSNFNQGVYATGTGGPGNTIAINETDFYDNSIACRIKALDNVQFTLNNVTIGGLIKQGYYGFENKLYYQIGYYSDEATGYEVEQNTFVGRSNALEEVNGINIVNSGSDANEVYKNIFENNAIGQKYDGLNRFPFAIWSNGQATYQGLQFLCNTNPINNGIDVQVNDKDWPGDDGIRYYQGSNNMGMSAANIFSSSALNIDNNSSPIEYFYNSFINGEYPSVVNGAVFPQPLNASNTCPDKFWAHGEDIFVLFVQDVIGEYYQTRQDYDNLLYTYYQIIDGGNTDSLLNAIDLYFPSDAQQMRNELMTESPYLSMDALKAAAATGILPDALLLEICLANPEATQSEEFLDFVEFEIPDPLPSNMVQLIYQNWDAENPRTLIEYQLADLNADLGRTSSKLIHLYAMDSIPHTDSIINMLESRKSLNSKYQLAELDIQNGLFDLAINKLNNIEANHVLSEYQLTEHSNLMDYVAIRSSIQSEGSNYLQLDENKLSTLRNIAFANTGRSSAFAKNILCFGYGECDFDNGDGSQFRKKSRRVYDMTPPAIVNSSAIEVLISPNPATNIVNVEILSADANQKFSFELFSVDGRIVKTTMIAYGKNEIDISGLNKAVYVYQVSSNKEVITKGKLIVQ